MAGELGALLKALGSPVLRWLPGRVLRWWSPVRKCSEYLVVSTHGGGPHIYINQERSPAIVGLNFTLMNRLQFPVKVEVCDLEFSVESRTITNTEQAVKETVPAAGTRQISVKEIHLSDAQARLVRQYPSKCPILRISGHASCASLVGEFRKLLKMETRAFIFRGNGHQ